MIIKYKLKTNLLGRVAAQLVWELNQIDTSINIISERMVNGKSLVGILSGNLRYGREIEILFEKEEFLNKIIEVFNEVGDKID